MEHGDLTDLPGAELVLPGLEDLAAGRETLNAVLVQVAYPRLAAAGLPVQRWNGPGFPEHRVYAMLAHHPDAHSRYNALIQRLVAFENALESRITAQKTANTG